MKKDDPPAARILLVDNSKNGLTARKLILVEHGYSVETAQSGEEAWEIFQTSHFDIVVTDYRMTGMDGIELIGRIRAGDSPARVIMLSGFAGRAALTLEATGADELLAKSNKEVPELLRAVKKLSARPRGRGASSAKAPRAAKVRSIG